MNHLIKYKIFEEKSIKYNKYSIEFENYQFKEFGNATVDFYHKKEYIGCCEVEIEIKNEDFDPKGDDYIEKILKITWIIRKLKTILI